MTRAARMALGTLVVLAPLPFGSVQGWATGLLAMGLGLTLVLAACATLRTPQPLPAGCGWIALATGTLALPAVLQLIPLPPALLRLLSPATAGLLAEVAPDAATWHTLSEDPTATLSALLWLVACGTAAFLVALLHDQGSVAGLFPVLLGVGAMEAFYGIIEYLSGRNSIFLYAKRFYLDSVTGTYINRNHFAGLMVMLLPVGLAWLLARRREAGRLAPDLGWRRRLLAMSERTTLQDGLLGLALTVMAAGLALSFSRAGVTLGALALALTLVLATATARRTRFRRPRAVWAVAAGLALLALVPLSVRGPGRLASMAEDIPQELSAAAGRPVVWAGALQMGMDHPLLGTGLGTFGVAFPRYRPLALQPTFTHAHQDYLQWFAETGLLGVIAALLVTLGLLVVAVRSLRPRAYGRGRLLACGLIAGSCGLALHGLVDFNGHIPANTLLASVMAGMLVVLARPLPGETGT